MEWVEKGKLLSPEDLIPLKEHHTISRPLANNWILFSLAAETDITAERYLEDKSYYILEGEAKIFGKKLKKGEIILVPRNNLVGMETDTGAFVLEGTWEGEDEMKIEKGQVLNLKDKIDWIDGAIANVDIVKRDNMKFVLLAFDEGQGLTPHSAPGDALVIALEGKAHVTMGEIATDIEAGQQIVFEKNIPHSVKALTKFKMALLMVV